MAGMVVRFEQSLAERTLLKTIARLLNQALPTELRQPVLDLRNTGYRLLK